MLICHRVPILWRCFPKRAYCGQKHWANMAAPGSNCSLGAHIACLVAEFSKVAIAFAGAKKSGGCQLRNSIDTETQFQVLAWPDRTIRKNRYPKGVTYAPKWLGVIRRRERRSRRIPRRSVRTDLSHLHQGCRTGDAKFVTISGNAVRTRAGVVWDIQS